MSVWTTQNSFKALLYVTLNLSLTADTLVKDCNIFIGRKATKTLSICSEEVQCEFLAMVKEGYTKSGEVLLNKLPLDNRKSVYFYSTTGKNT